MTSKRSLAVVSTALAAVSSVALAMAPTATAGSAKGCAYPRVCFYLTASDWNSNSPTAAFKDVTPAYQNLGPRSRGADFVHNTRNDDRVYLRYIVNSTGTTRHLCVNPNTTAIFSSAYTVTGIRIETAPACP